MTDTTDPVLRKRARAAQLARTGKRLGYGAFAAAVLAFALGASDRFTPGLVTFVVTCLGVGSVVLIPATVVGYGVRAADREERREGPPA
jgi:hypothetical protein